MPRDRPRLWESFKRALGTPPRETASEPAARQPSNDLPPFLAPDETIAGPPVGESASLAKTEAIAPSPEISTAPEARDERSTPEALEAGPPRSPRLARGLASFSRDNADREKKFRHILSDEGASESKKP